MNHCAPLGSLEDSGGGEASMGGTRQSIRSPAGKCNPSPRCQHSINIYYKNENDSRSGA